jgi:hypothetical protein
MSMEVRIIVCRSIEKPHFPTHDAPGVHKLGFELCELKWEYTTYGTTSHSNITTLYTYRISTPHAKRPLLRPTPRENKEAWPNTGDDMQYVPESKQYTTSSRSSNLILTPTLHAPHTWSTLLVLHIIPPKITTLDNYKTFHASRPTLSTSK